MATVELLADRPELAARLATMQWEEWAQGTEERLEDWIEIARGDLGRAELPVGFVALDGGALVGGVSLREFDIPQRRDRSPWVCGMIVRADRRGQGIGTMLMARLDAWAAEQGIATGWVWTGSAVGFYQRCGWVATERLPHEGQLGSVLTRRFSGPGSAQCWLPAPA